MIDINEFISRHVIERTSSMFLNDIVNNSQQLRDNISHKSILVIGGAGSIGSQFIKALLQFNPSQLVVVDINENGLAELTRDLRSSVELRMPDDYRTYAIDFVNPILKDIFHENNGFDIVANFSAHKHVRSEKDRYAVRALIENNVIKAKKFLDLLKQYPPQHFFCVSTDKAANPVNVMGASKLLMEKLIMSYKKFFSVTTARFANVAFSNGSLPISWLYRMMKHQPLIAPTDVKRFFVSPEESGQICMLACVLGDSGEIFFPKLHENQMKSFSEICGDFIEAMGYTPLVCASEQQAREIASNMGTNESQGYPVIYTVSDTTGEKAYEEFVMDNEGVDETRFDSLGVITEYKSHGVDDSIYACIERLQALFSKQEYTKAEVVDVISEYLPSFHHLERGKNLDQKM